MLPVALASAQPGVKPDQPAILVIDAMFEYAAAPGIPPFEFPAETSSRAIHSGRADG
jgi:hypothetical protein